jgi:hypothetical protein
MTENTGTSFYVWICTKVFPWNWILNKNIKINNVFMLKKKQVYLPQQWKIVPSGTQHPPPQLL